MVVRQDATTRSGVDLTPIDETTWRVCDDRLEAADRRRIVGYLRLVDGEYEMLWMRPWPGPTYRYPTMETAVAAVSTRLLLTSHGR